MPEMTDPEQSKWEGAHGAAGELRAAFVALGVPPSEVASIYAQEDPRGVMRVAIPPQTVQAVLLMLAGWGPYLGPRATRTDQPALEPAATS